MKATQALRDSNLVRFGWMIAAPPARRRPNRPNGIHRVERDYAFDSEAAARARRAKDREYRLETGQSPDVQGEIVDHGSAP